VKRLFWLGIGVVAGVAISRKAGQAAKQATPVGIAGNLGAAISELAGAIGTFGAEVRAGMAEREQELHKVVDSAQGVTILANHRESAPRHALRAPASSRAAGPTPGARARRADG
jgi:hypothetical protein